MAKQLVADQLVEEAQRQTGLTRFDGAGMARVVWALQDRVIWGPERPFYQRYQWVILDVRMTDRWEEGAAGFVGQLRDRLRQLGGNLVLVAYDTSMLPGEYPVAETVEQAVAMVKEERDRLRRETLQR